MASTRCKPSTALRSLRAAVKGPGVDRYLSPEIEETVRLVKEGALVEAVENATGYKVRCFRGPHRPRLRATQWGEVPCWL